LNRKQRVAVVGCGFFGRFQINAWKGLPGAELVAVCDQDISRARHASEIVGGCAPFSELSEVLRHASPDVVDIVTMPRSHMQLARLCMEHGVCAIIQKPMTMYLKESVALVELARKAGVTMMVHENHRFQKRIRELKKIIDSGDIGEPRYCSVGFRTTYQPFARDPVLRSGERILLADMGPHVFDTARFLMGDIADLSCRTLTVSEGITGDEMASALVVFKNGAIGSVSCSAVSMLPTAPHLDVLVDVEGTNGSVILRRNSVITVRSGEKQSSHTIEVEAPAWGSRAWAIVQDAVIAVCQHWLEASAGHLPMENSVEDNLKTMVAVEAAYKSAAAGGASLSLDDVLAEARRDAVPLVV
jgi:predicted dehydrogenase